MSQSTDRQIDINLGIYNVEGFIDKADLVGLPFVGGRGMFAELALLRDINTGREGTYGEGRFYTADGDLNYDLTANSDNRHVEINYSTESRTTDGKYTQTGSDTIKFVKTHRNIIAGDQFFTQDITRAMGDLQLAAVRQGERQARDVNAALTSCIEGVCASESDYTISGNANRFGQNISTPRNSDAAFYFDVNGPNASWVTNTDNNNTGTNKLFDTTAGNNAFSRINEAITAAFGDTRRFLGRPMLIIDSTRSLQMVNAIYNQYTMSAYDQSTNTYSFPDFDVYVTDRTFGSHNDAVGANNAVNHGSSHTSLVVFPNAISYVPWPIGRPSGFKFDETKGNGGGIVSSVDRWAYSLVPVNQSWAGSTSDTFVNTREGTDFAANRALNVATNWSRKGGVGAQRMLPIFHSP